MTDTRPTLPYNGWTNWDTWNANLWMCNVEGNYRAVQRRIVTTSFTLIPRESVVENLARTLRTMLPHLLGTGDGITWSNVNFGEIAAAFIESEVD